MKKRELHGMTRHPAYRAWSNARERCQKTTHPKWKDYGGRGITVCVEWENFSRFWQDMGPTYQPGLQLERIDNNAGYSAANCTWATSSEQSRNRRPPTKTSNKAVWIDTPLGRLNITTASKAFGIAESTICYRLSRGLPPLERKQHRIIDTPWGPLPIPEAAKRAGINLTTFYTRLRTGVPPFKPPIR